MSRCPDCNYSLVLLEKRRRYKCAKCSRVFLRKEVESKDFRQYNRVKKEQDRINFEYQRKVRRKWLKAPRWKDKRYKQEKIKAYYERNKERILKQKKKARIKYKEQNNATRATYRKKHAQHFKILARIAHWKQKQKNLIEKLFFKT